MGAREGTASLKPAGVQLDFWNVYSITMFLSASVPFCLYIISFDMSIKFIIDALRILLTVILKLSLVI